MNGIKLWRSIDAGLTKFIKSFVYIAVACAAVVLVLSVVDIIGSKFFSHGIPGATNIVEEMNVILVFSAIAYVQLGNRHMRITIFDMRLPPKGRHALAMLSYVLGTAVGVFFSWRTLLLFEQMIRTSEYKYGAVNFPLWPFGLFNFVGFVLLTIAFILCFCRGIINGPEKAEE